MTSTVYRSGSIAKPEGNRSLRRTACQIAAVLDGAVLPATVGLAVLGTGGALTHETLKRAERPTIPMMPMGMLYATATHRAASMKPTPVSAAVLISSLKSNFAFGASDVARALNVSRQAVYNWADGEAILSCHLNVLTRVVAALTSVSDEGLELLGSTFRRKLLGGATYAELIGQGMSVEEATSTLRSMLRLEGDERVRLAKRLGAMGAARPSVDAEFMPAFDERS